MKLPAIQEPKPVQKWIGFCILVQMFAVYILYSPQIDRFYIGQTEDIESRLQLHRQKSFKTSFTAKTDDWELFLLVECSSRTQAILIESHIKRMKSRLYITNLKRYPSIVEKLKAKYP